MKNVHYEIILQSLTEDMLRADAKIKALPNKKHTKMEITALLHQMTDREQLCLKSYLHNPIQLSPSDAEAIREHLYWQLKHYKHEEKRKK